MRVWIFGLTGPSCHRVKERAVPLLFSVLCGSALALFVLRVLANDHNFALALDDLALLAHGLNGRSDFHL